MTRKALITGITGQDGAYLSDLLLAKGYEVHESPIRGETFVTRKMRQAVPGLPPSVWIQRNLRHADHSVSCRRQFRSASFARAAGIDQEIWSCGDGTPRKLLDVRRLRPLGWAPRIRLRDGVEATYRWYAEHGRQRPPGGDSGT